RLCTHLRCPRSSLGDFTTLMCALHFFDSCTAAAAAEIVTLSLHDALPIYAAGQSLHGARARLRLRQLGLEDRHLLRGLPADLRQDRKSTRLNSSHVKISYAVFCLKKKRSRSEEQTSGLQSPANYRSRMLVG